MPYLENIFSCICFIFFYFQCFLLVPDLLVRNFIAGAVFISPHELMSNEHWLQTLSSFDITSWIYEQHWSLSTTWVDGSSDVTTCAAWCHQAPQHLTPIAAASLESALNMFYEKLPLLWIGRYLYCSKVRKVSDFSGHWPENNLTLNFPSLPFASKRC